MRSELDVLLGKIDDPTLRADIRSQVERLRAKRTFGLVFESHLPERVRLIEYPVRVGVKVAHRDIPVSPAFEVLAIKGKTATLRKARNPDGSSLSAEEAAKVTDEKAQLDSLVVVADFGEPVFPGLRQLGSIARGGNEPAHVVIKGENHHVLEALQFTHAGKVDCIYIDPPYNSGARDWKYDNNYVDETDAYLPQSPPEAMRRPAERLRSKSHHGPSPCRPRRRRRDVGRQGPEQQQPPIGA
jgi:adenine-specific DNA-methyltransferase